MATFEGKKLEIPERVDVLFFHTGLGDPNGIDDNIGYGKEFAFSGAGFDADAVPARREDAIPILRRFEYKECPVKPHHVDELLDYIFDPHHIPPGFCRPETETPVLTALGILCQTYLVAGIAEGIFAEDGATAQSLGWRQLSGIAKLQLRTEVAGWWNTIQSETWWLSSLGVPDSKRQHAKFRELIVRLVDELDDWGRLRKERKLGHADATDKISSGDMLAFLKADPKANRLAELLEAASVSPPLVEDAFLQIKRALAEA